MNLKNLLIILMLFLILEKGLKYPGNQETELVLNKLYKTTGN